MPTQREEIAADLAKHRAEYLPLSDDDLRAEMLKWKIHTPQYRAGEQILKERDTERDPTRKVISDLATRVENIERTATKHEFKTWSFWIALLGVLLAALAIALSAIRQ